MALICRMQITLRNGKPYRRPDGRPICWEGEENWVKGKKEESATPFVEDDALDQSN